MYQSRNGGIHKFLVVWITALILGAGLVLAAQGPSRADMGVAPSDLERQPLWMPGGNIPMAPYLRTQHELELAPPR